MPYTPQTWNNDDPATPLSAERLTHMELGIEEVDNHTSDLIDAHDASAISVVSNGGNVTDTVQISLNAIDAAKAATGDLAAKQSTSAKGAASGYASLDGTAKVPTAELATGTANSTTYFRGDRTWATISSGSGGSYQYDLVSDFGADPSGVDFSDTALAAATTAIRGLMTLTLTSPNGITLFIPRGYYKFASIWDLTNIHGLTIIGEGCPTSIDHNAATVLNYTGNGPRGIDCRSSHGVTFTGIQVSFTSTTFCGTLVDFSRYKRNIASAVTSTASTTVTSASAVALDVDRVLFGTGIQPGGQRIQSVVPGVSWTLYTVPAASGTQTDLYVASDDTAYCWFKNGNLRGITTRGGSDGTGGTGALVANISRLIGFGGSIICGVDNVNLNRAGRAIEGTYAGDPAYTTYSNVITIRNCTFYYISQPAIMNPGQSWAIEGNTFEGFQDIAKDHMPALATDRNGDVRSSGCKFTGNWCGDAVPTYWLDLYSAYGWEISGNYFSRIGVSTLPYMDDPWIKLYLSGGISITGNEFYAETSPAVNPPIFYAASDVYSGETDEAVRGVNFTANNVRSGAAPSHYLGLSDIAIFANDWPTTVTAPGNGYYLTDSSATVISSGGGGGGGTDETIHALDYLNGDGVAESLANINAFKAAANGKVVIFDTPSVDYNFANIGATGFVFTSPTVVRGPGCGNDQVTGGLTVGRLIFPDGVTAFTFSGNGSQGGASASSMSDIYIKGPINPTLGTNDGIRVRAGSFVATNVQVAGFNRDCWNIDTDDTTNANSSSFRNCHAYNAKRHGFYTVGTNSNGITFMDCDANTSVTGYGFYTGGPPTNGGSGAAGGYTNSFICCHTSFNVGGSYFDNGTGNVYMTCYSEDTRSTYANSWRLVLGADSIDGILLGISFGGFPVVFTAPNTLANSRWFIRNPSRWLPTAAEAGTPEITGSKGANAALTSLLTAQANAWLIRDATT